ncbi:LuxR C-terminal-related transcriptional regulator [Corynebacterium auriscanis]|uniref:LuxR C-terminal-related transcriptional regulator n=1 Tax=Corynebacterium auriscanis TaxID=99807 RepID=UPI003CFA9C84
MADQQSPVRVILADDHPVIRAGLEAMLATASDIEVVATVDTAQGAIDYVRASLAGEQPRVDVVLMDLRFAQQVGAGEAGGVYATREIRSIPGAPQVLVVTNYSTDGEVVGAVSAGAVGYLLKDCPPAELTEGIRKAARGQSVMSSPVMGKLMENMNRPMEALTAREIDVLQLAGQGWSNRQIARELILTEATIKSHMGRVFTKLGVSNRTAAVAVARERGIL